MSLQPTASNIQQYLTTPSYRVVPNYQRGYAWTKDHWENLLISLNEKENDRLFGTIVLKRQSNTSYARDHIVDGQQRTVTLFILLLALGAHADKLMNEESDPAMKLLFSNARDTICDYIYVSNTLRQRLGLSLVPPISYKASYEEIVIRALSLEDVRKGLPLKSYIKNKKFIKRGNSISVLHEAYNYFYIAIENKYMDVSVSNDIGSNFINLFQLITDSLNRLKYIEIGLGEHDDEQQVFEAMNTNSIPLTGADLVKNFFAYTLANVSEDQEDSEQFFFDVWEKEFGNPFWNNIKVKDTERKNYTLYMLRAWMESFDLNIITDKELLNEYKKKYNGKSELEIKKAITDITTFASRIRETNVNASNPNSKLTTRCDKFVYRCFIALRQHYAMSYLLFLNKLLAEEKISAALYDKLLNLYETVSIRRLFNKEINGRSYTLSFAKAIKNSILDGADEKTILKDMITFVRKNENDVDDDVFTKNLKSIEYRAKAGGRIMRMLLETIEDNKRGFDLDRPSRETSERISRMLTIEHICPQNNANWAHITDQKLFESVCHSLGNLTLLTNEQNAGLSNGSWDQKKEVMKKFNIATLNESVLDQTIWDESTIKTRTDYLVAILKNIWAIS